MSEEEESCREVGNKNAFYHLHPEKEGLVFGTDFTRPFQYCNESIEIPYSKLMPFLTDEGKAAVKSIMTENAEK